VLRNAAELAAGHSSAELVHQLRVGIRRTRTLLRHVYKDLADPAIEPALVQVFRVLGLQRDVDHVLKELAPAIRAAGGPAPETGKHRDSTPSPASVVRSPEFQDALLVLVALAHRCDKSLQRKARPALAREMRKLLAKSLDDGLAFEQLDTARQHRVRKRLKRLRYLAECSAPLYASRKTEAFITALKPVQDALGLYNDEQTALAWYRERVKSDLHAGFAVGWLTARREAQAAACAKALREFAKARPFWKND
jgi:CHAD domain-containing protein